MKKVIALITLLLFVLFGVYFWMRFASESRAREMFAEEIERYGSFKDNWSIENAYLNLFTKTLVVRGFKVNANDAAISVKTLIFSGIGGGEEEYTGAVRLKKAVLAAEGMEMTVDALSVSKFVLDRFRWEKYRASSLLENNPVKTLEGLKIDNFAFGTPKEKYVALESLNAAMISLVDEIYPLNDYMTAKNLIFHLPNSDKSYKVEKISSRSAYKDGKFTYKVTFDSQLFLLDASYTASDSGETPFSFNNLYLNSLELHYTDRSFANLLLDYYARQLGKERSEVIAMFDEMKYYIFRDMENAKVLSDNLMAFIKNPQTLNSRINPAKPIPVSIKPPFDGDLIDMGITVSFNGSEEIPVYRSEVYISPLMRGDNAAFRFGKSSGDIAASIDPAESPFLESFRKLYENDENKSLIFLSAYVPCMMPDKNWYSVACTKKDVDKMVELAKQGDHFSLSVLAFNGRTAAGRPWFEEARLAGEPATIVWDVRVRSWKRSWEENEAMLKGLESDFPFISATELLKFYNKSEYKDKFCAAAKKAYRDYGIFTLSSFFLTESDKTKTYLPDYDMLFNDCDLFGIGSEREDVLKRLGTDDARLLLGYRYVRQERYELAGEVFEGLYDRGDSLPSINAGFCLGMMRFYGKGYPVNQIKGWKLIRQSHDKGFLDSINWAFPQKNGFIFPDRDRTIKDTGNVCGSLKPREPEEDPSPFVRELLNKLPARQD
jgi:hypothetical protein